MHVRVQLKLVLLFILTAAVKEKINMESQKVLISNIPP